MDFDPNADGTKDGWGVDDGKEVGDSIRRYLSDKPEVDIINISFYKVRRVDASFPREAFTLLAKELAGKRGVFISKVTNEVVLDNIRAGADKLEFPLHVEFNENIEILGSKPKRTQQELYSYVFMKKWVSTSQVAEACGLKVNNASNKLKELVDHGFILRKEGIAESGGVEFYYFPIVPQLAL
ncbi:helix-turn-helix transcriptional regulator [Shewanella algae]|uniref:helix-turn-helix transcriptional regulator n=1 Tax=Shewanella algae TaxID=38313 RepID=UPI0011835382|nr:helix-turn-helix transcriptional regulator [Shewanella algae]